MHSAMRLCLRGRARHAHLNHGFISPSRSFGTSTRRQSSSSTLFRLRIGSKTRVIFQGFTGRQATFDAQESIEWGTNIVGGVSLKGEGDHLGLPVLPTVRQAVELLKPDATAIYVPAIHAPAAIEAAIEAEVPLIVAVAEHVALHDMLRIRQILRTQSQSRLVGPNSPGIISATEGERCRIGFHPLPCFSAGCVGIAARSGTLSYEAVASTTRAGLGQSLVIGVGGDVLPGTDLVEALRVLEEDPATKAIAIIGEVGGDSEILAAQWIRNYHAVTPEARRKPIVGLVAGRYVPTDRVMGHAGAFWVPGEPNADQKVQAFNAIGVPTVNHPAKIGDALKTMLQDAANRAASLDRRSEQEEAPEMVDGVSYASPDSFTDAALGKVPQHQQQTRGLHTSTRSLLSRSRPTVSTPLRSMQSQQVRSLRVDREQSLSLATLLRGTDPGFQLNGGGPLIYICISIDRATATQCVTAGRVQNISGFALPNNFHKVLLPPETTDLSTLVKQQLDEVVGTLYRHLRFDRHPFTQIRANYETALSGTLLTMAELFKQHEAAAVWVHLGPSLSSRHPFYAYDMHIEMDDGAGRPGGRLADQHARISMRSPWRFPSAAPAEIQAASHGIVYHRLQPNNSGRDIGTVVNGAGLAMNTIDALQDMGGSATNFLDTGGKATAETVRHSFEAVLHDKRVRVVFVNIFGGLTRGDMIARGIVQAVEEMQAVREVPPVVVRIRGTNEAEGQAIIAQSGLPLYAFDDFEEAAAKAIELARGARAREDAAALLEEAGAKAAEKQAAEAEAEAARLAGGEEKKVEITGEEKKVDITGEEKKVEITEEESLEAQQVEGVEKQEDNIQEQTVGMEEQEDPAEKQEDNVENQDSPDKQEDSMGKQDSMEKQ